MGDHQRKQRALVQRLFLIESKEDSDTKWIFTITGSTGNIYDVTMTTYPSCTCPDHTTRHKRCKHIYFVMRRIMKCSDEDIDDEKYTDDELKEMFNQIPKKIEYTLSNDKIEKYKKLKNKTGTTVTARDTDDICPICMDELTNGEELDYCKYSCGKNVHKACYELINKVSKKNTCVFCFQSWFLEKKDYLNINDKC